MKTFVVASHEWVTRTMTVLSDISLTPNLIFNRAVIDIPLDDIDEGTYKLVVTVFVAEAKAEQPLPLHGHWEAEFTK